MMRAAAATLVCLACWVASGPSPAQSAPPARDSGIVEQADRRLMQVDVSVRGPAAVIDALTESDFTVAVGREDIEEFVLDRVCVDRGPGAAEINVFADYFSLKNPFQYGYCHFQNSSRRAVYRQNEK